MTRIEVTEHEIAMILDALWSHSSALARSVQQHEQTAATDYRDLANRLSKEVKNGQ